MKRFLEFTIAFIGFIVFLPVYLIVAISIKLETKGPVLYRAKRVGKGKRLFTMYKFRTMIPDAERSGPPITTQNDCRITRVGGFLRKTKLDEVPQLINILKGDMQFVGPRPEDPDMVKAYSPEQKKLLQFKPGITSPASLRYRDEENHIPAEQWETKYMHEILPAKLKMDLEYMQKANVWSDLKVILRTVFER